MKSALMILPNHSWMPANWTPANHIDNDHNGDWSDGKKDVEKLCENRGGTVSPAFIPLDEVKLNSTLRGVAWKRTFRKKSIYPPIIIDLREGDVWLVDGHHRVTVWREWGCTHAPAWVIRKRESK